MGWGRAAAILSHVVVLVMVVHWNIIPYTVYGLLRPVHRVQVVKGMQFRLFFYFLNVLRTNILKGLFHQFFCRAFFWPAWIGVTKKGNLY